MSFAATGKGRYGHLWAKRRQQSRAWEKEKVARPGCSTIGENRWTFDGEDEEEDNRMDAVPSERLYFEQELRH